MARIEDIERRLLNWARWRLGGQSGGLGYSTVNLADAEAARDGYREAVIPTVDCEAEETDRAVVSLASELRATVESVYLGGGGLAQKARRLCCSIPTIHARVDLAHRRIQAWLADAEVARKAQRERIERLQAAARP
jgi:hypothetical protein